jgi:hypothetical protein
MLYPDRQAFFKKLALSLPPQPAIKIRDMRQYNAAAWAVLKKGFVQPCSA